MDYDDFDFTDNRQLSEVSNAINKSDREFLILSLKNHLQLPLPDDNIKKLLALKERSDLFNAIKSLNNQIDAAEHQWTPPEPENLPLITKEGPPSHDWLIENWLPRNELTVFSGMGGTGKSHIMLNLACALACGCPEAFLDAQGAPNPDRAECTMFASWEDSHGSAQRRTKKIEDTFGAWFDSENVTSNVIYRDMKPQGQIWIPATESGHISNRGMMSKEGHELLADCTSQKVSTLILDSIAAVFGQDLNSAAHVRPFLNYLSAWANEKEITVLLIGHPNKTGTGGVSGSVDWHNGVRSRWELEVKDTDEKDSNPYYALIHAKANDAPQMPDIPLKRHTNGIYEKTTGIDHDQQIKKAQKAYQEYKQHWENWEPYSQEDTTDEQEVENPYVAAFNL